jgi:Na+/H+ antiporter NhaD/arsenite permease-like protein
MRRCIEIATRFGLLAGLFLSVVLLAVGLGAITHDEQDIVPGPTTATAGPAIRPTLVAGLVGPRTSWRPAALSSAGADTDPEPVVGPNTSTNTSTATETPPHEEPGGETGTTSPVPHVLWSTPFVLLLLAIAVLPLVPVAHHWWERNSIKLLVGLVLSAAVLAHYGWRGYGAHGAAPGGATVVAVLEHAILRDFVPFLILLFSLYVIAGGLQLKGHLHASPAVNTAMLGAGAVLASLIGTTGASMVLIRPLLQTNRDREHVRHTVVFFIFLVSNIGGCLLPTGDPPLFMGYLSGVPFGWTLKLAGPWLFCIATLLAVYFVWDRLALARETRTHLADEARHLSPLRLHGTINLLWLLGVVLAIALIIPGRPLPGTDIVVRDFVREGVLLVLTALSLATTPRGLRKDTEFSHAAMIEVACLFFGIFLTMQVPIEILQRRGAALNLTTPSHYFWATGLLSSFLDNTPTYLVFFETARSLTPAHSSPGLVGLLEGAIRPDLLAAISLGAVFMGANTYIGNAPNLMVKLIAEQRQVAMPGFFGYMLYSVGVLIPLFALTSFLFFR